MMKGGDHMDNRITIRHQRKREFFSLLALNGQRAQDVLSEKIDRYLENAKKEKEDVDNLPTKR